MVISGAGLLRRFAAVLAVFYLHCEVPVGLQFVALQRVTAHVRILCHAQVKPGTGRGELVDLQLKFVLQKSRCVVIHVLDINFDTENVQRVLHQRLEADRAGRRLAAHLLPVQPLVHVQVAVLLIHREVLLLVAQPQLARRQLVRAEPQVPRQRPHERASAQLLGDGVAEPLGRRP
uniref:Secreted protein n=1 Tax=Cyanistes caeruleus TaxID=156563 RepID=A0A8C0U286_CYACU